MTDPAESELCSVQPKSEQADKSSMLSWRLHEVIYQSQLSYLYHRKRERFLALCDRVGKAIALICGTAAFSSMLGTVESKSLAGLAVSVATLPGLVFAWSDKARLHSELAQKYILIEAEIAALEDEAITEEKICDWKSRLIQLQVNEPPTLGGLVRICQNQMAIAVGEPERADPLSWWRIPFVHIIDMQKTVQNRVS